MLKCDPFCLWKESLNCDGYKFYQYQQNEHPPLTSSNWTQGDHDIMPLIIIQISKYNTDINKQLKKACTDSLPLKKTMHLLLKKMNDNINMDNLIAVSVIARGEWCKKIYKAVRVF